jgi:hypothetical protein
MDRLLFIVVSAGCYPKDMNQINQSAVKLPVGGTLKPCNALKLQRLMRIASNCLATYHVKRGFALTHARMNNDSAPKNVGANACWSSLCLLYGGLHSDLKRGAGWNDRCTRMPSARSIKALGAVSRPPHPTPSDPTR